MHLPKTLLLLPPALLAITLLAWPRPSKFTATPSLTEPSTSQLDRNAHLVEFPRAGTRRPASQHEEEWDDEVLIKALARLGKADLPDPGQVTRIEELIALPSRARRTLELLQGPNLYRGAPPSQEERSLNSPERGAVLALGFAAATYGRPALGIHPRCNPWGGTPKHVGWDYIAL